MTHPGRMVALAREVSRVPSVELLPGARLRCRHCSHTWPARPRPVNGKVSYAWLRCPKGCRPAVQI